METQIETLLKSYGMSVTPGRKKILRLFHLHKTALAHADIETALKDQFDRVTVYRTLQVFLEKGILHTVPTTDNAIKYALCREECKEGRHHDNHIHFLCRKCGVTSCLPETNIPQVPLPKGFLAQEYQMVVNGYCKECV